MKDERVTEEEIAVRQELACWLKDKPRRPPPMKFTSDKLQRRQRTASEQAELRRIAERENRAYCQRRAEADLVELKKQLAKDGRD